MIWTIIVAIVLGGIVGMLARLALPGKQDMSIPKTIGVGVVANLVVAVLLSSIVGSGFFASLVGVVVAVGLLFLASKQGWVKTTA